MASIGRRSSSRSWTPPTASRARSTSWWENNLDTPPTILSGRPRRRLPPPALGSKTIHPYSDFLLHEVDTGDGIVQNSGRGTANKLRTPPLWGVRTRTRLLHDGHSLTFRDAVLRHGGEAGFVTARFLRLEPREQRNLIEFLKSL